MVIIYNEAIRIGKQRGDPGYLTSRKLYLSYPTNVFVGEENIEFEIINEIARHFNLPFPSIQVVGSAKTGFSYVKKRDFIQGESDLDIAVINMRLFRLCLDYAYQQTNGYTDLRSYQRTTDLEVFRQNLLFGFINPFTLPRGDFREDWIDFFNTLSTQYIDQFKKISGGIYATQYLFEMKQYRAIEHYLEEVD